MHRTLALRGAAIVPLAALALAPAAAQAARPTVTTGATANVVQTSANLLGTVDPNGETTSYSFQYGTTKAYGSATPSQTIGGNGNKRISVSVTGLTPNKRYHYRLIASNSSGQRIGGDRTFTTPRQPLGLTLTANPLPVPFGSPTTFTGTVTGTGNAGVQVALQANPFPYTDGFKQVGNTVVADQSGNFAFPNVPVGFNSQIRVVAPQRPSLRSAVLQANVRGIVATRVGTYRVHKGSRLTFSGTIRPAAPGTLMAVMRKSSTAAGGWAVAGGMTARTSNSSQSKYSKKIRITRSGTYAVYAGYADGKFVPAFGREIKIRVVR